MGFTVMCCIKYFVFFISMLLAITGVALMVIAFILLSAYHNFYIVVNEKFSVLPFLILLLGMLVLITALLGCCGTIKDNHCLLTVFASLLLFLLILGVIAAITTMIFQQDLKNITKERMISSQKKASGASGDPDLVNSWDSIQALWHCCGVNSASDWGEKIPNSCCLVLRYDLNETSGEEMGEGTCEADKAYNVGCLGRLNKAAAGYTLPLVLIPVLLAMFLLLGSILSFLLAHTIRKCLCENFQTTSCTF